MQGILTTQQHKQSNRKISQGTSTFLRRRYTNVQQAQEKISSLLLTIKEMNKLIITNHKGMNIKIEMRCCLTPIRMAAMKKNTGTEKVLATMWRSWNPSTLLVGIQNGTAAVEIYMEVPQKNSKQDYHAIQQFHFQSIIQKN